jgi:hypothetical protein
MIITVSAHEIREGDFITVWGKDGWHRVTQGAHRDPFSESYHYTNVVISSGKRISYGPSPEQVRVLRV